MSLHRTNDLFFSC